MPSLVRKSSFLNFFFFFSPLSIVPLSHLVSGCSWIGCDMLKQTVVCKIGPAFVVETTYKELA